MFSRIGKGAPDAAIGMLPATTSKTQMLDWLGFQSQSVAVWLDGTCRQNGQKVPSVNKIDPTDVVKMEHDGKTTLTFYRNDLPMRKFLGVPADWRFAAGAFGGAVQVLREGEDAGSDNHKPRVIIADLVAFRVPDGDMGEGRSDAFVQIELLSSDGKPIKGLNGKDLVVQTKTNQEADSDECPWNDVLAIPLPDNFLEGQLHVTVWDDDENSADDCLGGNKVPIQRGTPVVHEKLPLKGHKQPGAAGYYFTDFEISFNISFGGLDI